MEKEKEVPAEIVNIAEELKQGKSQRQIANDLKIDPSNFHKKIKKWRTEYPTIFN